MKLLFVNQFFWPDSSATSQQLTDMAAGLAARGHDVTVLCGEGGYAAAASSQAPEGVRIVRVKGLPFARGRMGRVLSYASFLASASARALRAPAPDAVVTLTTPPLLPLLGTAVCGLRGSSHLIWEQDMFPDVAVDLGYLKRGSVAERALAWIAGVSRTRAHAVIALGECMKARLVARGVREDKILIAENWANGAAIQPMPRPGNPDQLVLLYSGHLGLAHDLDTMCEAMLALREDPRFRFLFVGSARERRDFTRFVEDHQLTSVEFRPYVERDRLSDGLAAGDIGLVTQRDACCGTVVPSKVYGILAAGRPVLFIGPREATPARLIARHDCGWQVDCGDAAGLTRLLLHLAANRDLVHTAGARARKVFLERYDLPGSIVHMETLLTLSARNAAERHEDNTLASLPSRMR